MSEIKEIYSKKYYEYLKNRSKIRKWLRLYYLRDINKYCIGKTIDFGCGVGELLKILPEDSIGYEVNNIAVDYCKSNYLNVELYNPETDEYKFKMIKRGDYKTFTMNHVLEHLDNTPELINKLFESCNKIGISRIVFTLPGVKGYNSDSTHLTFIDLDFLRNNKILENKYYCLKIFKYFPLNMKLFTKHFTHNELRLIFEKRL